MESAIGHGARQRNGAGEPQPSHLGGGAEAGRVFTGGRQIRLALPHPESACPHNGGGNSGLTIHSELTSGKGGFPAATARRLVRDSGTVLAVKGSLRRAKIRRHLLAIHRPFLAGPDCHREELPPYGPHILFRGRPVYFNSIFVDGFALFPQMDVWSRNGVGPIDNGSAKANRDAAARTACRALQEPSVKCREKCFFP
jgi:hypothetical protein